VAPHECRHYRIEKLTVEGRDFGADAPSDARIVEIPWCSHPRHSPLDQPTALSLQSRALQCDGALTRCPLSPAQFADAGLR
jgi:hypothetical protein